MTEKLPVLIIDDDPVTQLVVAEQLEAGGSQVETAADGIEGLAKAKSGHYRFILMDCQMPLMDGFTRTQEIRLWEKSQGSKEYAHRGAHRAHARSRKGPSIFFGHGRFHSEAIYGG